MGKKDQSSLSKYIIPMMDAKKLATMARGTMFDDSIRPGSIRGSPVFMTYWDE